MCYLVITIDSNIEYCPFADFRNEKCFLFTALFI